MNDRQVDENFLKINGISKETLERLTSLMQDIDGLRIVKESNETGDIFILKLWISYDSKFSVTYQRDEVMLEIVTDNNIWNESLDYVEFISIEII